jgi:hypothetical protein
MSWGQNIIIVNILIIQLHSLCFLSIFSFLNSDSWSMVQKKATDDCNNTVERKGVKVFPKVLKGKCLLK